MDQEQAKAFFVVRVLMAVIAFTLGLGLAREDFARVARERKAVLVGMTAQTILVPLLGFAVAFGFRLEPKLAIGLVLLCACPGGIHSNYYNKLARGDVALSMTLTSVSTLVNMGTLPLWVLAGTKVFSGHGEVVTMSSGDAIFELVALIGFPLLVGMAIRARKAELAARVERGMMITSGLLLVLVILGSVLKQAGLMVQHAVLVGLPVLVLQAIAMGSSYAFARVTGLPMPQRITVALEGGIQNATLAFALAIALTRDLTVAVPAIVYSVAIYFTAAVFIPIGRATIAPPEPVVD
ncbi:MAG: bile acid:sodium symporter family protein [Polyangiales bacterium]